MTIISKFRLQYFAIGILGWSFLISVVNPTLIVLYANFCIDYTIITGSKIYFEYLELEPHILILWILLNALFSALYYIFCWKLIRITLTKEQVIVQDVLTRAIKRIKYNEITEISGYLQMNNYMPRSFIVGRTAIRVRRIELKDGKSISFDDNMYKNFIDIDNYLFEKLEHK